MGTHPIFESDFDCLTERMRSTAIARISNTVRVRSATAVGEAKIQTPSDRLNTQERADYALATSRLRVLTLYKAFMRATPSFMKINRTSLSTEEVKRLVKNEFARNSNMTDTRAIELCLVKGQMDLQELTAGLPKSLISIENLTMHFKM